LYILQTPAPSSKLAGRRRRSRSTGKTAGQTDGHWTVTWSRLRAYYAGSANKRQVDDEAEWRVVSRQGIAPERRDDMPRRWQFDGGKIRGGSTCWLE